MLIVSTPVALNSFQGPFLLTHQNVVEKRDASVVLTKWAPAPAARWMLKQVQHDDSLREAAE